MNTARKLRPPYPSPYYAFNDSQDFQMISSFRSSQTRILNAIRRTASTCHDYSMGLWFILPYTVLYYETMYYINCDPTHLCFILLHSWYFVRMFSPLWYFFSPVPPPVLMKFVVFPPGCGDSVADLWGWGAHEAQLRCPNGMSGDMYVKMRYQEGPLSLSLLTTQTMVTMGIFPYQEIFPW